MKETLNEIAEAMWEERRKIIMEETEMVPLKWEDTTDAVKREFLAMADAAYKLTASRQPAGLARRCVDSVNHPWDGKEVVLLGEAVEVTEPTWICGLATGVLAMQIPERLLERIP